MGIVRVETELIRAALRNDRVRFFSFSQGVPKELNRKHLLELIPSSRPKPSHRHPNSIVGIRRGPFSSLTAARQWLYAKIQALPKPLVLPALRVALYINGFLELWLQAPGFFAEVFRHVRLQIKNESSIRGDSKRERKQQLEIERLLAPKNLANCEKLDDCEWSIFSENDSVVLVGFTWEHVDAKKLFFERASHGFRVETMCYDTIPHQFPHLVPDGFPERFCGSLAKQIWSSDHISCISKQSEADLSKFIEDHGMFVKPRTSVVRLGDTLLATRRRIPADAPRGKFVLYVSTLEKRKNHAVLLRTIEKLQEKDLAEFPEFVFVGMRGWNVDELFRDLDKNPMLVKDGQKLIRIFDNLSEEELLWLYSKAWLVVFPSIYEGWGLSVSEALKLGKPVFTSKAGALLEAGQGMARALPGDDAAAWSNAIAELLEKPHKWDKWVAEIIESYTPQSWQKFGGDFIEEVEKRSKESMGRRL